MKAIVWTQAFCNYCHLAKKLLEENHIEIEERNISEGVWKKENLREAVPNVRTVPQIFLDEQYIGGYDDLVKWSKKNVSS